MADEAPAGDIRSAILAELAASKDGGEVAPVEASQAAEAPADTEQGDEVESDETAVEAAADDAGDEAAPEEEAEDGDADEEDEFKSDDPETQKGLDQIRRVEKRTRERLARREAELEAKEREIQSKADRAAEIDRLGARVKYDPAAVLRAFGVQPEDFELIAQAIYAESPALANDPKQKAAAQAKLREREKEEKLTATERRIAELEAKLEKQQAAAAAQAEAAAYIQQLNADAAKFPRVSHALKADAEDTHDELVATFGKLERKLGRRPKPGEVVAAYDKRLAKLGLDPATIVKPPAKKPAANGNKPAAPATPAKPVATNGATPHVDERDAILAELAGLRAQN